MKLMLNINQRKSLALGHDAPHSTEVVEFDPAQLPEDVRVFLAAGYSPHNSQWRMQRQWTNGFYSADLPAVTAPVTVDSIIGAVREMQEYIRAQDAALAVQAQEKAEQQARLEAEQERLAAEISAQIENGTFALGALLHSTYDGVTDVFSMGVYTALEGSVLRVHQRLTAAAWDRIRAVYAEQQAAEREKEAVIERAKQAKMAAKAEFVRSHMDNNAQARFEAGVLPSSEITEAARALVFAPLASLALYVTLTDADSPHAHDVDSSEHEVQYDTHTPETMTASEWKQVQAVKRQMPDATVELVEHQVYCADDYKDATKRMAIHVTVSTSWGENLKWKLAVTE
jgi:hypothetical protein